MPFITSIKLHSTFSSIYGLALQKHLNSRKHNRGRFLILLICHIFHSNLYKSAGTILLFKSLTEYPGIESVTWVYNILNGRWRHLSKSGQSSTRSALSDRLILYFYFSFAIFLKVRFVFHLNMPCWVCLVQNLVIRWRCLHWFLSWPPGCVTCIATMPWNIIS